MLSDLFYWILNMSLSASVMGLVICLLGKVRSIPRRIVCALWAIPFLRMWIPVGINSKYSLMSLIQRFTSKTVTVYEGAVELSMMNHIRGADMYFPITYKAELLGSVLHVAAVIWLIVAAALVIALTVIYIVTKRELKDARHWRENVYISDAVLSPATYGVFRAKILLPQAYAPSELRFVLMHENAHVKRNDNLWRILAILTACLHWFNPFVWLFLKWFLETAELACDEAVLRSCSTAGERKSYARTLLACAESKSLCVSAFGGAKVRVRMERILSYKRLSVFSTVAFAVLAVIVGYVLLTN